MLNILSSSCQEVVQEVTSVAVEDASIRSDPAGASGLRIGELSRRVGVTPEVLRAWERRYGVLQPRRSQSGQRLYTAADEARVRQMLGHMEGGYAPAVAARLAPAPAAAEPAQAVPGPADLAALCDQLRRALHGLDEAGAEAALDRLLAGFALDTV